MVSLALELERQLATKRDLIVPPSLLQCHTDEGGELKMIVDTKRGDGGEYGVFEFPCIDAHYCPDVGKKVTLFGEWRSLCYGVSTRIDNGGSYEASTGEMGQ